MNNSACPCWSGYHFMHSGSCGCPTCDPKVSEPVLKLTKDKR